MQQDDRDEGGGRDDADGSEPDAKEELFEAIDHFKSAATILFNRATKDPTVRTATQEAERIARKIGDAAEPLAKQLTSELTRLTRDVMGAVEGAKPRRRDPRPSEDGEDE